MKVKDHIHRLRRHKYANGSKVFFCTLDCSFKIDTGLSLGAVVICNICGNQFEMNEYSIKLAKPHCNACGKIKVTDAEGKPRFINKGRSTEAIADMGKAAVSSMRDRMSRVVTMEKPDEDI